MRSAISLIGSSLVFLLSWSCSAQQAAAASPRTVDMSPIVVTGVQPGPRLWKVTRGSHVLWVLGTWSPLPANIQWESHEVDSALRDADEVLGPPRGVAVAKVGFFSALRLWSSASRATNNPKGRTLRQVLPAETFARWEVLKSRYIGRDNGIEKKRPWWVASELYSAALRRSGLRDDLLTPAIDNLMKRRKIKLTSTDLVIVVGDPRQAVSDLDTSRSDSMETACLEQTMDFLETRLPQVIARANAWSTGDLDVFRTIQPNSAQSPCQSVLTDTDFGRKRGMANTDAKMRAHWVQIASASLKANQSTFAMLPLTELLDPNGYLADLQAKGDTVTAPQSGEAPAKN